MVQQLHNIQKTLLSLTALHPVFYSDIFVLLLGTVFQKQYFMYIYVFMLCTFLTHFMDYIPFMERT